MGKKNLEQLFKESFQDFQEVPDEKVWASIEASLDKKKQKKRAVPIWWGLGGAAAALIIALLAINPFGEEQEQEQIITDVENISVPENQTSSNEKINRDFIPPTTNQNEQNSLVGTSEKNTLNQKENQAEENSFTKTKASSSTGNNFSISNQNGSQLAQIDKNSAPKDEKLSQDKEAMKKNNSAIVMNIDEEESAKRKAILSTERSENQVAENTTEKDVTEKQSIYDAIAEQEQLEEAVAKNNSGKWSVGPSLAPVYFNGAGDGSPVGADFATNSKTGNLNLSYGVNVAYEVGKKVKIRSGVHRVNFGYNTNDVVFSSTLQAAASNRIANIDYDQNSETILVQSKESAKNSPVLGAKEVAFNEVPSLEGKMVQQLGYIEVPLEVNYALLDKKFGVDLIGGVSSLFLVDNSVLLESNELVTEMGEANNINSLNFSANFGMGLNYHFTPKFRFNVEPVFKYQLNTFSNVSGNFQPYSIGVYSGFTFKF
ncbi:outer membrane beta-barrel protein [Muricauda brasiliensis]|uniref:outer membrane beta-barrel protein n=1 Tax=Muricauda brasiliensis TaxID=2162892 RepID=UPI000D34963B|nr:outer membrane beta-barrel protein [Muricauda brasiliensis]